MNETIENILNKPYSRNFILNEDSTYSVEILEFSGCYSQGDNLEEAMNNLNDAARDWIEASLDLGQDIPEPNMNKGYSGRIVLRMPKGIHRKAASMAETEGVSLNHYLVTSVAARVGAEDFFTRLTNRFERRLANTAISVMTSMKLAYDNQDQDLYPFIPYKNINLLEDQAASTKVRKDA